MKRQVIPDTVSLKTVDVGEDALARLAPAGLTWMLQQMILIRQFEEAVLKLKDEGLVNGPVHSSVGQEAVAVGVVAALRSQDWITGSHRAHHQYLAKALCALAEPGFNPLERPFSDAMREAVRVELAEIMGLAAGCSGGRGGSMHLTLRAAGVAGTNAIVAGGVPHAAGFAWADRFLGRDKVTVCFLGDGAVYQGVTHEASNLASIWQAPVIFFIENNHYAVATNADKACSAKPLTRVASAYGMPAWRVDGTDAVAIRLLIEEILRGRGDGGLPCYVEADVYRTYHHAGNIPGSAYGYRDKEEEKRWRDRDAIDSLARRLRRLGLLDDKGLDRLNTQAADCIAGAVAACTSKRGSRTVVKEELWPDTAAVGVGLRDETSWKTMTFVEPADLPCDREIKYSDAIAEVTGRWLERDPGVVVLGEEVANFGGGPYGATKGLPAKFPGRILNTPISEAGFCGLACGAAMNGMHPVVELMFGSFALVAADQLFNQIGQLGHIYGGHVSIPLVVRTRVAIGLGYGAQHSLDPTALFALFPGWRVFVPTTPFDYIGLFNAAMRSTSPTLLVEHHEFYNLKGPVPVSDLDFAVRPGKAAIRRQGKHVTVVAHGWPVRQACEAAETLSAEGVEAEVIDLRTVDDAGLDYETIGRSLAATGALVIVEQAPRTCSIGAKIVAECERRFFDSLDGPSLCIAAPDVPLPVSARLEQACIPTVAQMVEGIRAAARRQIY